MIDTATRLESARTAYSRGEFWVARAHLDEIIDATPFSPHGLAARYLRARGHEDGYFGTKDLQAALADYGQLGDQADLFGSDGLMGCARVLFEMGEAANEEEIIGLCLRAISVDKNVKAMMLLGLVHERVLADYVTAGAWYRRAYLSGLPWGMRYYARMHWERGHYVRGGVGHLIATLTSPLMVAFGGARSPLK